jgi:hypothetical protein
MIKRGLAAIAVLTMLAAGSGPAAADPWKDESGHGWSKGHHAPLFYYEGKPGKYEWRAGGCKYEYKVDGGGFKQEAKCDGKGPYLALLPPLPFVPVGIGGQNSDPPSYVLGPQIPSSQPGRFCREFQKLVQIGGRTERAYGVACRQADGSWKIEG